MNELFKLEKKFNFITLSLDQDLEECELKIEDKLMSIHESFHFNLTELMQLTSNLNYYINHNFKRHNDNCVYQLINNTWQRWGDYDLWLHLYNIPLKSKEDLQ